MIKYFKGDFVFSKIRCRPFQKKQSSFPNTSDNNFDNLVSFSLLLASFHYYWLFWPTQSWHCHHSHISLTLYYGLCRAQSRTKLFPALSRTKLFPALSRTKSMYHGPILEISALSISLLIKRMSGNFELISLLPQLEIEPGLLRWKARALSTTPTVLDEISHVIGTL